MREFKVGDRVVDYAKREEVVLRESGSGYDEYILYADFQDGSRKYYSKEGKHIIYDKNPMIFHVDDCPEWAKPARQEIPVDQLLEVWDTVRRGSYGRFAKWGSNGQIFAWTAGYDSYTAGGHVVSWEHYRIIPDEEAEQILAGNLEAIK